MTRNLEVATRVRTDLERAVGEMRQLERGLDRSGRSAERVAHGRTTCARTDMTAAARHWAGGGGWTFDLYEEHRETFEAWALVCNQWLPAPSGRIVRLDWPAAKALFDAAGRPLDADCLDALRAVEREVLAVLAERPA